MMKLIQNIDVYAPQHLGKKDVLTINDNLDQELQLVEVIAKGNIVYTK